MKVYYIWDAYCGWCYGFDSILKPFLDRHPDLELEVISGGLFNQDQPISAYPHIAGANQEISRLCGVTFGPAYQAVLEDGSLVLDSNHAALGYEILRAQLPQNKWMSLASALQEAFYQKGKSLSDPDTYAQLASDFGLDAQAIAQEVATAQASGRLSVDFTKAAAFGVTSFPTLIIEKAGKFYDLRDNAMTLAELEENLEMVKAL